MSVVKEHAILYPDKEELEFRFKIESSVEKEKKKIAKKLNLHN